MKRPNIIQVTTHDSGRQIGCCGHPTLDTPNTDRLAGEGVLFTRYFCAAPICSASRATQLTGLYPQRHGLMDLVGFGWRIRDGVSHLAGILRGAGYRTFLFGQQHETGRDESARLGFETVRPAAGGREAAAAAAAFLRSPARDGTPFYLQVGFRETHTPYETDGVAPDTSKGLEIPPWLAETPASREIMAGYQGSIARADECLGTILAALRESGLEENTILVFTTDHGIEVPRAKWHLYDPGIGIFLIMRYPRGGVVGGRRCDALLGNVDYLPTVLELAGVPVPPGLDGTGFAGLARGEAGPGREAVYALYQKTNARCARTGRFKLTRHFDNAVDYNRLPVRAEDERQKRVIPLVELHDLERDPLEFDNVAGRPEYASAEREMNELLWNWLESVSDPLLRGPVRTPTYEAALGEYAAWKSRPPARPSG